MLGRRTAAVLAAPLLAGCGEARFENPRGTISVEQGEEFVLDFPTSPGAGFDWRLDTRLGRGGPVGYLGYDTEVEDPDKTGGPVRKRFRFDSRAAGRSELRFTRLYRGAVRGRRTLRVAVR